MTASNDYREGLVSHELPTEGIRLRMQERLMDPQTILLLGRVGVAPWWRCLELGAGCGSVARWLAERCPAGHVTATDLDMTFLDGMSASNLEVLRHDVTHDDFTAGSFDLVHARALFVHLADPDAVIARVAEWLAPGGWLVVEEPCMFPIDSSPYPAFQVLMDAFRRGMEAKGVAVSRWARSLPAVLADAGLTDVRVEVTPQYVGMGGGWDEYWRLFVDQVTPGLVDASLLDRSQVEAGLALLDDSAFVDMPLAFVAAWGRKPGAR